MQSVNQLRAAFLDYFKKLDHQVVASSPLIPHNDPTLMFTNAGMVQFKDVFPGSEKRSFTRATSSQKCVRAGGKHNDLDNVGYTARHHTFFEMLGNFSFGDYFKEDAIIYSWEFLTKVLGLPADKLLVTVYHTDDEAWNAWKKLTGFSDDRIIRIPTKDNFWAMGDTGPCGPCSEIFYDHGEDVQGGPPGTKDQDGDRFVEIWNLVFMQFEKLESGEQVSLPSPSIDTGMGLERISAVLQGVHDNYDTDLFKSLITTSKQISGNCDDRCHNSHRVIVDHLRASSFLLADGVMPSNEGRGYVLRRIMRRAMRHAHQIGCKEPLMYRLVPSLVHEMTEAYPELTRAQSLITEILKLEEERFKKTLDRGLKLLEDETAAFESGEVLSGDVAFKLYDTYGFPLDMTVDIMRGRQIDVDEAGFNASMQQQKNRARAAWKGSGEQATDEVWFEIIEPVGITEFLGYESSSAQAKIMAIVKDGQVVECAQESDEVSIILNQTPFYGESGGQQGDIGQLFFGDAVVHVSDTRKLLGDLIVHVCTIQKGTFNVGDIVTANIDIKRRNKLRANHSATHILHAVLREVLGDHVTQKGSLVAEDRLRFDISQPKAVTREELSRIEEKVNAIIRQNSEVGTRLMSPDEAIKAGALALFGEKYGDEVRVVNMGLGNEHHYSVELCGGTHVKKTGDIGVFKIISESAIAAGIRRIEAVTGQAALDCFIKMETSLHNIATKLKVSPEEIEMRIDALLQERKKLEKDLSDARKSAVIGNTDNVEQEQINGLTFIGKYVGDIPPKDLRGVANDIKNQVKSGVVAVTSSFEGKGSLIVAVSDDLTPRISAVELVKSAAEVLGAKGAGGKPNLAQTGGPFCDKTNEALDKIREALSK